MNYRISTELDEKEMYNLWHVLGEFRRITRDQYYRYVGTEKQYSTGLHNKEMLDTAESLAKKLVEGYKG
ncbi:MAG: hypothetical protein EBU90_03270 [Proteobacteria bacterium]|nr:hypothetical protein [Pseudomonadota bacterium]NBP13347.1 hypothetical protein [bacterium]